MKKLGLIIAVSALVFELSQCKKPNVPEYEGTIGDRVIQNVTLNASRESNGNFSTKVSYDGEISAEDGWVMKLKWDENDEIIAYDSKGYCGTLTLKEGSAGSAEGEFDGKLAVTIGSEVKFYYFGSSVTDNGGHSYTVDFSTQYGCVEPVRSKDLSGHDVISNMVLVGTSPYRSDCKYSTTMGTPFSIVKIKFENFGEDNIEVAGIASTGFTIDNTGVLAMNETTAATLVTPGAAEFYAVFMPKSDGGDIIFRNTGHVAKKPWTLDENTFYTKTGSSTGEPVVIKGETPAADPTSVTTVEGCSNYIYSCGGTVTLPAGGAQIVEFGVVYSETESVPEVDKAGCTKVSGGTASLPAGTTDFNVDITGFIDGHTYYVRAYAIGESGTVIHANTTDGIKTMTGGNWPKSVPDSWNADGTNPHPFTVGEGVTVKFSRGNLQWSSDGTHAIATGGTASGTWHFAEHQFDFLGNNGQGAESETVTRDLFGWGTSGYHQNSDTHNKHFMPYSTSMEGDQSPKNYYGYGPSTDVKPEGPSDQIQLIGNINGSYYDWGVYNAISNGGHTVSMGWRTLTNDEWGYLFKERANASDKWSLGKVSCTQGMIILPDDWVLPDGLSFEGNVNNDYTKNCYSYSDWSKMESAGAVFLPAAGRRERTEGQNPNLLNVGSAGGYWSSSSKGEKESYHLRFAEGIVESQSIWYRHNGYSVRLVTLAE